MSLMSLEKLVKEQECSLCMKVKDDVVVTSDEQGESFLCWLCIKKMANRKQRLAESKRPPTAVPVTVAQTAANLARLNQGNAVK